MTGPDPTTVRQVGPYPVLRLHAEGGQAWIFVVQDPKFSVRRALKALKPQPGPAGEFERFRSEAQVLATLSHPYLLTPYDFGRDEETGWFYYTMDFVEGETLADRLSHGPMGLEELRAVLVPVLDALCAVHDAGVVHRDIKPSNILISDQGHAYLADLGIMVGAKSTVQTDSGRTQTGLALGTARYMSPEQARGRREEIGPPSDVFSLGLVVFEALTGKHAYADADLSADSGAEILMYLGSRVFQEKDLDLRMDRTVPKPLQAFVRRACRLRPEERFADARAMREEFLRALRASEGSSGRVGHLGVLIRSAARTIGLRDGLLVLTALLLVVGFVVGSSWRAERRAGGLLERAGELERAAASVLRRLEQATGALGVEAEVARRGALFELDAARAYLADGMAGDAAERAERAVLRFEDLCARAAWSVQKRSTERAAALTARVSPFDGPMLPEASRAPRVQPERWALLQAGLAALQAAPESERACEAAAERLTRLEASPALEAEVDELEKAMASELRDAAESLRGDAEVALRAARQSDTSHPSVDDLFRAGRRALTVGDEARADDHWLLALSSYGEARLRFEQVAAMAPVLAVKLRFEREERRARSGGAEGLRRASRVYDHAERLLLEGDLESAAEEYRRALELLPGAGDEPSAAQRSG